MVKEDVKRHILRFLRREGVFGAFIGVYLSKTFDKSFDALSSYKIYGKKKYFEFFNNVESFTEWDRTKQGWEFWYHVSEKWQEYCSINNIYPE